MTEERKREIMMRLEKDDTDDITREEAKEFIDSLTKEEEEHVHEVCSENRRKRNFRQQIERQNKRFDAYDERVWEMRRLKSLFDTNASHKMVYEECRQFVNRFLIAKKPNLIEAEGIGSFFECADCESIISKGQPFCVHCGLLQDWGQVDLFE